MTFTDVENILVIKLRHIGDVLLTVPVFRALKETFPGARVSALVNKGTEGVLENHPLIDEILAFDRDTKKLPVLKRISKTAGFVGEIRRRHFDMTVDLTGGDRPALMSFSSGARYRLGWESKKGFVGKRRLYTHLAKPDWRQHTVLQNLTIVKAWGISSDNLAVDFHPTSEDSDFIRKVLLERGVRKGEPLVHVHPSSRWLFKCWRDDYMAEIIRWLIGSGVTVAVTSSPVGYEMAKTAKILDLVASKPADASRRLVDLSGKTSLGQLGALAARADLFFGVDSAPMHLAAAVGTPVVALFGPSGAFNWGPWDNAQADPQVTFARCGVQRFGQHTVLQSSRECVPCGQSGCGGNKRSLCLEEITPEQVMYVLEECLSEVMSGSAAS